MVIKFFCKCGKKVSVPDNERNLEGTCPKCGELVSLKDADPTRVEREPLAVIDVDGTDAKDETNEFGIVKKGDEHKVEEKEGTPEINPGKSAQSRKRDKKKKSQKSLHDTDTFDPAEIRAETGRQITEKVSEKDNEETHGLQKVSEPEPEPESGDEALEPVDEAFRHIETEDMGSSEEMGARLLYTRSDTREKKILPLYSSETTIGSSEDMDIILNERGVSKEHCRIIHQKDEFFIEDAGSTNGVRVNGKKIDRTVLLKGDKILLGKALLYFMR